MFHLIEDDRTCRETFHEMLTMGGFQVFSFESVEAYSSFMQGPEYVRPVAIFTDVNLPGNSGYDLVVKVRETNPFQKMVFITAVKDGDHHYQIARDLQCGTLEKPFRAKNLIVLANSLIKCHQAHQVHALDTFPHRCEFNIDAECPFHQLKY